MKKILFYSFIFIVIVSVCTNEAKNIPYKPFDGSPYSFKLEEYVSGFTSPVGMAFADDGSGRAFVLEQPGRIKLIKNNKLVSTPFLNITSKVVPLKNVYAECGLLGIAFHPDYKKNRRFFIYYSAPSNAKGSDHKSIVAEYKVSESNPDVAENSEKIIMEIEQPESNHNGGHLLFGKDGYLYIGLGDGGGGGDKHGTIGNAQNLENLLGKILRIDVNKGNPYSIPADNPFVNKPGRDEIWAYGLRNPWRFSFDKGTNRLFCGDVGQNKYEETDIIEKGKNYGWRMKEGKHVFDENMKYEAGSIVEPIDEYDREFGYSVNGGFVYRGKRYPELTGKYVFSDWSGKVFYLTESNGKWNRSECYFGDLGKDLKLRINGAAEDPSGEIYFLTQKDIGAVQPTGVIYKLSMVK